MIDNIGHIIGGGSLCYLFIPKAELWVLILFSSGFGAVREHIQKLRHHDNKGKIVKYTDTLGWCLGSIVYYLLDQNKYLDADKGGINQELCESKKDADINDEIVDQSTI